LKAKTQLPLIGSQLTYGIFEALFVYTMPLGEYIFWGGLVSGIGWAIGFLISLKLIVKWLSQHA
jgi:hypothetical protein